MGQRLAFAALGGGLVSVMIALAAVLSLSPGSALAQAPDVLPNGRVRLEGVVRTWHGDTEDGRSIDHGAGIDDGHRVVPLRLDDARAHELAGKRVRIDGLVAQGSLTPDAGGTTVLSAEVAAPTTKRVAVILMHFSDRQFNSNKALAVPTTADVANTVFNDPASIRTHFEQSSDGLASISGDVLGWYTIPYSYQTDTNGDGAADCAYSTWSNAGRSAASAAGVNLSGYDYFVYVFPTAPACGWAGLGQLPGSSSWSNGYISVSVIGHELGHNWGVHHASYITCSVDHDGDPATPKVRASLSANPADCTASEYGDPFSVMGNLGSKLHNNFHRAQLGWLPDRQTITTSGRYQLGNVNGAPGVAPRLLTLARPDGTFLALELRQSEAPHDSFSSSANPSSGISIRVAPSLTTRSQTKIVDATPGTTSFGDAALPVGGSLFDPVSGVTITDVSVAGSVAEVDVAFTPDSQAPTAPGNLGAVAQSWSSIQLTWSAATDNVAVAGYRITRDGVVVGTTAGTLYTDGGRSASTTYSYEVQAFDGTGNYSSAATASATTPSNVVPKMRVSDVKVSVTTGRNRRDQATAVVKLVNEGGNPVGAATVTGTFRRASTVIGTKSGTTSTAGTASIRSDQVAAASSGTVYEFCVSNASLAGYAFDPAGSALCGQVAKP